jgi:hypothetical protein
MNKPRRRPINSGFGHQPTFMASLRQAIHEKLIGSRSGGVSVPRLEPMESRLLLSFTAIATPVAAYTGETTNLASLIPANGTPVTVLSNGTEALTFSSAVSAGTVPGTWTTWNSPAAVESATPRTLEDTGATALTISLSNPASVFGFEMEPSTFGVFTLTATFKDGGTTVGTISQSVNGSAGALLFAASTDQEFTSVVISAPVGAGGFALAQPRYALAQAYTVGDELDNTFLVQQDGAGFIDIYKDGVLQTHQTASTLNEILIYGEGGNDTLIVDSTNGLIASSHGIRFDGGTGFNRLVLTQTGGAAQTSDTYSVGPNPGEGTSVIVGAGGTQTVFFQNLAPVVDTVAATTLTINGTPAANAISYTQGSVATNGLVSIDNQETMEFSNKTNLVINGLGGSDEISLNYNSATNPTGLTGTITVNGGDPTASDTLIVNGISGALDNLRFNPTAAGAGNVVNDNQPQPQVNFTGIEHLKLVAQEVDGDGVRIEGTTGNDVMQFRQGATSDSGILTGIMDSNNATTFGPFVLTETTYSGVNSLSDDVDVGFFNPGGSDSFVFNGTAGNDLIAVSPGEAGGVEFRNTINGQVWARFEVFNYSSALVRGYEGDDTLTHDATITMPITFEGGDPSGSDTAVLTGTAGVDTVLVTGSGPSTQTVTGLGGLVTLSGVEVLTLNTLAGADSVTVNYLNHTDLGLINIDVGSDAVADAVTVSGGSAADTINVGVDGAVTEVTGLASDIRISNLTSTDALTINGAQGNDALTLNGVVGALDNLRYTPTAAGAGTVVNDNAPQATVNFTGIEHLHLAVQQADGDGVRVDGTAGNDAFEFHQGATADSGVFTGTMDTNNATTFGPFALTEMTYTGVNGASNDVDVNFFNSPGGTDSFAFNGTAANDLVAIAGGEAGGVEYRNTINGQEWARIEVFNTASGVVRGHDGDDTFTHDAAITIPITLEGGDPSDSDTAVLNGTSGVDTVAVTRTGTDIEQVTGLGGTVTLTGIEDLTLNTQGGADAITINYLNHTDLGLINIDVGTDAAADSVTINGGPTSDSVNVGMDGSTVEVKGLPTEVRITSADRAGDNDILFVYGNDGADTLTVVETAAATINVTLEGGAGNDILDAQTATFDVFLRGGAGNDTFYSGLGNDYIDGETGTDRVVSGTFGDTSQNFTFILSDTQLIRQISSTTNDTDVLVQIEEGQLIGGTGDDLFQIGDFSGRSLLLGDKGSDTVDFSAAGLAVTLDLDKTGSDQRINTAGTLVNLGDAIENFTGSFYNDQVYADAMLVTRTIDGGNPVRPDVPAIPPGDFLSFDGQNQNTTINHNVGDADSGTATAFGYQPVNFISIEKLAVTNSLSQVGFGAYGQSAYTPSVNYPMLGTMPTAIAIGDLDGDGYLDMVTVNSTGVGVASVRLGLGDGTFGDPVAYAINLKGLYDVELIDMDGDGSLDIVTAGKTNIKPLKNSVAVLLNNGDGTFSGPSITATNMKGTLALLSTGDVDGDGAADVLIGTKNQLMVLTNDGSGNLSTSTPLISGGKKIRSVSLTDVNGDDALDILALSYKADSVSVFLNDGSGGFTSTPTGTYTTGKAGKDPTSMVLADFNTDGILDVAVSNSKHNAISVLLGAGDGSFNTQQIQTVYVHIQKGFYAIAAGDVNGDGKQDLVIGHEGSSRLPVPVESIQVLLGNGNGTFSAPNIFGTGDLEPWQPASIALADFNNDGGLDIAVVNSSKMSNSVSILLKAPTI